MKHRIAQALFFTLHFSLFTLLLTSCEYKELCTDHPHVKWVDVNVVFDWSHAEEADVKGMTVLFYSVDNPYAEPIRYDFAGNSGGKARLGLGTYRAVAYNNDTETILLRNFSPYDELEAYTRVSSIEEGSRLTRSGMPRLQGTEQENVILEPDPFYATASDEPFTLTAEDTDVTIVLKPDYRYYTLDIIINNVPNLQYTGQFGGALSGLSASRYVASGECSDVAVTEAYTVTVVDATTLKMELRYFGHCPHMDEGESNSHLLAIYAILADGSKWYYGLDITEKLHDAPVDEHTEHVVITIDEGIPVPKPIVNGSGFQPTIDGWQGEEIEVKM